MLARNGVSGLVALRAALLHDTIEDTETTVAELNDAFGGEVLGVVLEVTDDKQLEKGERKRLQVEKAPGMLDRAKLVKLGDKICNVTDVASSPPAGWSRGRRVEYLDWTEAVVRGCRGVHAGLLALIGQAHARLIAGGRGGEVILDTADASDTRAAFSEALALLASDGS